MKASFRWLQALVPDLRCTAHELAERFTAAGLEVEAVTRYGVQTDAVLVAEVRTVEPHPTREKLRLVTVDRGGGIQRVVCGASNVPAPGGLVALAPVGTVLPAVGMTLAPREIGGVASEGMLCSESELGLVMSRAPASAETGVRGGSDDAGIIVLPSGTAAAGVALVDAVPATQDWILDISVTPNRPDALGHVGLAREAAALFAIPFAPPSPDAPARVGSGSVHDHARVQIDDTERCPRYGAAMVDRVTVGPSPGWLRYRLESLGIRPISNVVDVTNLALLEHGHPMHAFDLDCLHGDMITVRRARAAEVITTLDGTERALDPDDLVITDGNGAVALAGIMGTASSEIRATTRRVLLECAYFTPRGIRRASRRHALHTESSHRFERGVDPDALPDVLAHTASLLTYLAGGAAVPGSILVGPGVPPASAVRLRGARMRALLGVDVPLSEAVGTLTRLGCRVTAPHNDAVEVGVPSHRPDLRVEADLIEEVVRVRGVETVPAVLPPILPQPPRATGRVEARARVAALELGLSEAVTYGFVSDRDLEALGAEPATIRLANPLTEDRSVMRTSLLPGLFEALRRARRRGRPDVRLFTVGARFMPAPPGARLPREEPSFAAVLAGSRRGRLDAAADVDVWDAKGIAVEIVERVTGRDAQVRHQPAASRARYLHPRGAGDVLVGESIAGRFGILHPDAAERLDIVGPCVLVEVDLAALDRVGFRTPTFRPIPALPASTRDIAVVVHDEVAAGDVAVAIRDAGGDLCEFVELFDLFRGGAVPENHRSLAYHVVYRDPKAATEPDVARTLTDSEVDARHQQVVSAVRARFGAVLRA